MAERKFREIVGDGIEGDYWKPTQTGESIEGKIVAFPEGEYGEQILLKTEDGAEIELPAHRDLQSKQKYLQEKEYIKVTLTGFKKSNNPKFNDKPLYKVEVAEE